MQPRVPRREHVRTPRPRAALGRTSKQGKARLKPPCHCTPTHHHNHSPPAPPPPRAQVRPGRVATVRNTNGHNCFGIAVAQFILSAFCDRILKALVPAAGQGSAAHEADNKVLRCLKALLREMVRRRDDASW